VMPQATVSMAAAKSEPVFRGLPIFWDNHADPKPC
jgi:hypothetical protein